MDIATWPAGLDFRPSAKGYVFAPGETRNRTEMEQGVRDRRTLPFAPDLVELAWSFELPKFDLFRSWYRYGLEDGAKWFRLDIWTGTEWRASLCLFTELYEPVLTGLVWRVPAKLQARPFVVVEA